MTPDQLKTHAATFRPLASEVLLATAKAQLLRAKVDAIKSEILAADVYMSEALSGRGRTVPARRITEAKDSWLIDDEGYPRFSALLDARVRAEVEGAADLDDDHCPALVAEKNQQEAEQALLEATAPLFGVTAEQINRNLKTRQQWLDTWLGACVNL